MSTWRPFKDNSTYYILVDGKPAETVDRNKPDTKFCMAFVDTSSCFLGVRDPDLPWFKQYKESSSLDESLEIVKGLFSLIMHGNFQDLRITIFSSTFSVIESNGLEFLKGCADEVNDFEIDIENDCVYHKGLKINLAKAEMLIWYNYCLSCMAPTLTDSTLRHSKNKGTFLIDRLGDSDKRIMDFMRVFTFKTSLNNLWIRCAEDHNIKPERIGFDFASVENSKGQLGPVKGAMQDSLVDWIVFAAYAFENGQENRPTEFQKSLLHLHDLLVRANIIKHIHIKGDIRWLE